MTIASFSRRRTLRRAAVAAGVGLVAGATPASAAHNLIVNGSFETGDFTGFKHINTAGLLTPAVVIDYNNAAAYGMGGGAFGEAVPVDNAGSPDADAPGGHGVYFVDDFARNEALTQMTALHAGNYEIGFDVYLPANGANNVNDATLNGAIIGVDVANFTASRVGATHWYNISGVATVKTAGYYLTSFSYNAFGLPAKDFVVDKVYVQATSRAATFALPPTPTAALPEPEAWMLMLSGFVFVGTFLRRRPAMSMPA